MNLTCSSCGSKRLLRGVHVTTRGYLGDRVIVEFPHEGILSRPMRSPVSADVCVDCGLLDLRAVDLMELQRLYAAVGEPLGLEDRRP